MIFSSPFNSPGLLKLGSAFTHAHKSPAVVCEYPDLHAQF